MNSVSMTSGIALGMLAFAYAMADESRGERTKQERTIPLSEIVTTSPQKDLQSVKYVWEKDKTQTPEAFDNFMRQIQTASKGSSNIFLVDATNIHDAMSATFSMLVGLRSADTPAPVKTAQPKRGSHWLVAYLGSGPTNPTWWTIESVQVSEGKLVLSYRKSKPMPATDDVHPYYYWIALGKLSPGAYKVQLFDTDKGVVTLMRRVEVTSINE